MQYINRILIVYQHDITGPLLVLARSWQNFQKVGGTSKKLEAFPAKVAEIWDRKKTKCVEHPITCTDSRTICSMVAVLREMMNVEQFDCQELTIYETFWLQGQQILCLFVLHIKRLFSIPSYITAHRQFKKFRSRFFCVHNDIFVLIYCCVVIGSI